MDGAKGPDYAAWYQEAFARRLAELQARQQECGYRAHILGEHEVAGFVGAGWRGLVDELHRNLLALDPESCGAGEPNERETRLTRCSTSVEPR